MNSGRSPNDNPGTNPNSPESLVLEGSRWLEFLGEGDLVGMPIPYFDEDGRQRCTEEFPLLYRSLKMYDEHVRRPLIALKRLPLDHPKREVYRQAMRNALHAHLDNPAQSE